MVDINQNTMGNTSLEDKLLNRQILLLMIFILKRLSLSMKTIIQLIENHITKIDNKNQFKKLILNTEFIFLNKFNIILLNIKADSQIINKQIEFT